MATDLKNQFLLLQEQQKKKLLRRNQLKSEESNKKAAVEEVKSEKNLGPFSDEMDLDDDLNLKAIGLSENGIDDEEIKEMEETIRELRDENGRLYKLLGEKGEEMKILKRRWQDEKKELTGQSIGSENVAQKIIELSKKNRDLTAEVESGKTKYRQIQNEMQKLENELKRVLSKPKETQAPVSKETEMRNENKTAELEVKVGQLNSKLMEYRNQVDTQKKELKIAHKVLAKEVGDGVNIQSLLNTESNWRGRQQTIINLQKKIADLQQSVSTSRQASSRFTNSSVMSSMSYQSPLSVTMQDEKIRSTIKKIEMERKETQQKLQNDLNSLQNEHSSLKEKHNAAKTRNQVLTQELKNTKSQVATLVEKGKHDDDLVSALMREQDYLKTLNAKLVKEKEELESSSNNRVVKASHDVQIVNELKKQIEEQEKKVKQLEDEIQSLKDAKTQEKHKDNRINSANANLDGQLTQKPISRSRPSLIPTPPASAERKNGYRYRRTSSAKNEDISSLRVQLQEVKSMSQAAEVERDRLLELVQVLQNRINDATENCIVAENKTIELKRTTVKLEKQVERLRSNLNTKSQHGIHGKTRPTSKSRNGHREKSADELYEEFEEMRTRLEIQADENDALKEALNSTLKAKNDDIKIYQEMVEQTKLIFIQGMKQFKQSSTS